jgi:hypothetical protein
VFFPIKTRKSGRINYKYISCPTISTRKINTGKSQYRENQYRNKSVPGKPVPGKSDQECGIYRLLQYTGSHGIHGMKALFFDPGPGDDRDTGNVGFVLWFSPTE